MRPFVPSNLRCRENWGNFREERGFFSFLFALVGFVGERKRLEKGEFQEDPFKTSLSFFGSEVVRREIKDRKLRGYCSILGEGGGALFRRERTWVLNRRVF